ncbi:tyrosine-type recombinase/integrase [Virgibacillus dakarensis]|nr:tyrosine-type recombinase/integrase [Virgibacillus dakarensis]MBT2215895.1 tyrosine-type recombinase/integrase [Virgibacillus dakarensis]
MLLSEVWNLYKSDKQLEGYSPVTIKGYELQSNLFIRHQGDTAIEDVTYEMMKSYLAEHAARLKPASIAFKMKYFKSVWRYAHQEGIIITNPAARLREPKQGVRVPKSMSEEAIEMLRVACETPLENAILELFFSTGCRIGEVADQLRRVIKRIAKKAGIDDVYPHKLRHSYATHLLNNDAPLEVIQSFLGHSSIEITKIYAMMSGERRKQLYQRYF